MLFFLRRLLLLMFCSGSICYSFLTKHSPPFTTTFHSAMDSQIGTFSSNALEPEKTSAAVLAPSTLGDDVNVEKSTDEEKIKERKQVLHRRINSGWILTDDSKTSCLQSWPVWVTSILFLAHVQSSLPLFWPAF